MRSFPAFWQAAPAASSTSHRGWPSTRGQSSATTAHQRHCVMSFSQAIPGKSLTKEYQGCVTRRGAIGLFWQLVSCLSRGERFRAGLKYLDRRSWPAEARASVIAPIMVEIAEIASSRASPVEASVYWAATKSIITSNLIEKDFLVALSPRPPPQRLAARTHRRGLSRCLYTDTPGQ